MSSSVWMYGDGNSTEVFDALDTIPLNVDLIDKTRPQTSPYLMHETGAGPGFITEDLDWNSGTPPDIVIIGYAASALSLWFVTFGQFMEEWAFFEAASIVRAADRFRDLGSRVLLSIGPGIPRADPRSEALEWAVRIVEGYTTQTRYPHVNWGLDRDNLDLWQDGVHPSPEGAAIIALRIASTLELLV